MLAEYGWFMLAFQNIPQGSIFIEKQTAVHIAFQNTMCGSFFREKLTAVDAYI